MFTGFSRLCPKDFKQLTPPLSSENGKRVVILIETLCIDTEDFSCVCKAVQSGRKKGNVSLHLPRQDERLPICFFCRSSPTSPRARKVNPAPEDRRFMVVKGGSSTMPIHQIL